MKRLFIAAVAIIALSALGISIPVHAQSSAPALPENRMDALCLPNASIGEQLDCEVSGPAKTLSDLAKVGITFPSMPLPVKSIDPSLAEIPYRYAKITTSPVPAFNHVPSEFSEPANRYITNAIMYISYQGTSESDAGLFFLARSGEWFDGNYIARASVQSFQGVNVLSYPRSGFGWIVDAVTSQSEPGYGMPANGKSYLRFSMVSVYETRQVDNADWTQIGPQEWVEKRFVARVLQNATPPKGVENGRWIEVNLYDQTIAVYDHSRLVFATLISTGIDPFFTQPGLFQIHEKLDKTTMSGSFTADHSDYYYLEDVPWTMYYDGVRALHGAYWHSTFGYPHSHGCVNLSVADSHWLYNWASLGDWVYVWDPSGRTPTDPSYYAEVGAY